MSNFFRKFLLLSFVCLSPSLIFAQEDIYKTEVATNTDGNIETIKTYDITGSPVQTLDFSYESEDQNAPQKLSVEIKLQTYSKGSVLNTVIQDGVYDPGKEKVIPNVRDLYFSIGYPYELNTKEVSSTQNTGKYTVKTSLIRGRNNNLIVKETTYRKSDNTLVKEDLFTYIAFRRSNGDANVALELKKDLYGLDGKIQGTLEIDTKGICTITKYAFMEGTVSSLVESYYPDGTLKYEGNYTNGKKEGTHTSYYSNGIKSREENYSKGILNGYTNLFYEETGAPKSQIEYKDGNVITSTKYDVDGVAIKRTDNKELKNKPIGPIIMSFIVYGDQEVYESDARYNDVSTNTVAPDVNAEANQGMVTDWQMNGYEKKTDVPTTPASVNKSIGTNVPNENTGSMYTEWQMDGYPKAKDKTLNLDNVALRNPNPYPVEWAINQDYDPYVEFTITEMSALLDQAAVKMNKEILLGTPGNYGIIESAMNKASSNTNISVNSSTCAIIRDKVYSLLNLLNKEVSNSNTVLNTYETEKLVELNEVKFPSLNIKIDKSNSVHFDKLKFLKNKGVDVSMAESNFKVNIKILDVILGLTEIGEAEFDALFSNNTATQIREECTKDLTPINSIRLLCLENIRRAYSDIANTTDISFSLSTKIISNSFFREDGAEYKELDKVVKGIKEKDLDARTMEDKKLLEEYRLKMKSVKDIKVK